jgi:hypothetical protein
MTDVVGRVAGDAQSAAIAAQASEDIKRKKEKEVKARASVPGLTLAGMPKAAENPVSIKATPGSPEQLESPEATEVAENILTEMDKQLGNVQKGLKDFIAKKIRLAAHNPSRSKELLRSAYNDTKKAYDKIKKVRDHLA